MKLFVMFFAGILVVGCSAPVLTGGRGGEVERRTEIHMPPRRVRPFFKKKTGKKDDSVLIREQISAGSSYIKYLHSKYRKVYPDLSGKVDVEITVDEFGKVESCNVVYQSLGVDEMVADIVSFIEGMAFKGLQSGDVIVGYQFFF